MKPKHFFAVSLVAIIALLLLAYTALDAQTTKNGPRFGLKLGVNGSNLYDDAHAGDFENRLGLVGGIFAKLPVPVLNRFAIRPELLYSMKGGQYSFTNNVRPHLELGYVELPVSLELNILRFINIHGGVHAAYLLTADGHIEDAQGNNVDFKLDEADFERVDYGWHVGGGLDFGNIGLHLRFERGLKGIRKVSDLDNYIGSLKNSAFTLSLSAGL